MIISVAGNISSGKINLSSLEAGVWTLTITAYEKALLGEGVDSMTADQIVDKKATCAVLSGNAVVDLTKSNATTSVTLTPDGIGTEGKVALTLKFNQEDLNKKDSKGLIDLSRESLPTTKPDTVVCVETYLYSGWNFKIAPVRAFISILYSIYPLRISIS